MKRTLAFALCFTLILTLCGCKKAVSPADSDETDLYKSFLNGEITYKNSDGAEFYITDFNFFGEETEYALYDMNGDDIPELLVKMTPELHTFTILDNQVKLWRSDTAYNTRPLNNGCMLYEHHGGAPEHASYTYIMLDFDGKTKRELSFSYWEADENNPEWYDINGEEVSKEVYETIIASILEIGDDKIEWMLINGKPSPKNEPNNAVNAYYKFLRGELAAKYVNTDQTIYISGINGRTDLSYSIYDINFDGTPELLTRSLGFSVFSFKDGELLHLYSSSMFALHGNIGYVLEDGRIYYALDTIGTSHTFVTVDKDLNATEFVFFDGDVPDNPLYIFGENEVSKEEFDSLTAPYFAATEKKADLEWKTINRNGTLLGVLYSNKEFIIDGSTKTLNEFLNSLSMKAEKYTFINLDEDSQEEVIIRYGDYHGFLIIDYSESDNKLYGYDVGYRALNPLKIDGRFQSSDGAAYGAIKIMKFNKGVKTDTSLAEWDDIEKIYKINGTSVESSEFFNYIAIFENTPDVTWMDIY